MWVSCMGVDPTPSLPSDPMEGVSWVLVDDGIDCSAGVPPSVPHRAPEAGLSRWDHPIGWVSSR